MLIKMGNSGMHMFMFDFKLVLAKMDEPEEKIREGWHCVGDIVKLNDHEYAICNFDKYAMFNENYLNTMNFLKENNIPYRNLSVDEYALLRGLILNDINFRRTDFVGWGGEKVYRY